MAKLSLAAQSIYGKRESAIIERMKKLTSLATALDTVGLEKAANEIRDVHNDVKDQLRYMRTDFEMNGTMESR